MDDIPAPGPPSSSSSMAESAKQFKEWLDTVFAVVCKECTQDYARSIVYSHHRRRGRKQRSYGVFQRLKCSTQCVFVQTLDSLDWYSKGVGVGGLSAGEFYTVSGIEGQMIVASQSVGPFV